MSGSIDPTKKYPGARYRLNSALELARKYEKRATDAGDEEMMHDMDTIARYIEKAKDALDELDPGQKNKDSASEDQNPESQGDTTHAQP